jgi:hypothetical protein
VTAERDKGGWPIKHELYFAAKVFAYAGLSFRMGSIWPLLIKSNNR